MVVGDVCADQKNNVRFGEVFVRPRRSIAAKRALVSRDGAGHAQCRVSIKILGSQTELDKLAQCVKLLGDKLAGTHYAERVTPIFFLNAAEFLRHDF